MRLSKQIIKGIFIGLGFFFIVLGGIGIVLPVLPTAPFFMLAALCFAKGSERFHKWFVQTGLYCKYVEPAVRQKAMGKTAKRKTMVTLALLFTVSFLIVPIWHAKAAILTVAVFHVYYFVFRIKTMPDTNVKTVESE